MNAEEFRRYGHQLVDWVAEYLTNMDGRPVGHRCQPGEIRAALPPGPPEQAEDFGAVIADFENIIVPGLLHWNHPSFFGFFPANNSFPSILGELLSAGLAVNGMNWDTSPAVTELEEHVLDWVRQAAGLPDHFRGCIQDTASSGTLVSLICARERVTGGAANEQGLTGQPQALTVYASREAHSSVEKAAKAAGFGRRNFRAVGTDRDFAMDPALLEEAIQADLAAGRKPTCVVATVGTTTSTGMDPLPAIGEICRRYGIWLHVDGAIAGSAGILPEMRHLFQGLELADSYVFNPHKWLMTNADCSLYYVADVDSLTRVFTIMPEYLKTAQDNQVTNLRDWSIQLGRRFRALKLWFVIRSYGLEGLRGMLRDHLAWTRELTEWIDADPDFERMAPVPLQTVCFRHRPKGMDDPEALDEHNRALARAVNADGRIYITQSKLGGRVTLRLSVGQTMSTREHVRNAWATVRSLSAEPPA